MNWGEELLKLLAVGFSGGVLGSIVSPFAQDLVAKRKERRDHRRALVASWREGLEQAMHWNQSVGSAPDDARPMTLPYRASAWAQSLMHHADPKITKEVAEVSGWPGYGQFDALLDALSSEVSRIAHKWGVE